MFRDRARRIVTTLAHAPFETMAETLDYLERELAEAADACGGAVDRLGGDTNDTFPVLPDSL